MAHPSLRASSVVPLGADRRGADQRPLQGRVEERAPPTSSSSGRSTATATSSRKVPCWMTRARRWCRSSPASTKISTAPAGSRRGPPSIPSGRRRWRLLPGVYVLSPTGGSLGPQLRMSGALVTAGQFGNWNPIGAEQIDGLYKVVWQNGSVDQYVIWTVDGNGNFLSQSALLTGAGPRVAIARARLQPGFQRRRDHGEDVIESAGSTTLARLRAPMSCRRAAARSVRSSGCPARSSRTVSSVLTGRRSARSRLAAATRSCGRTGNQFVIWTVDGNGNFLSQSNVLTGGDRELQSLEPGFNQDFNGDGITTRSLIESAGSTSVGHCCGRLCPVADRQLARSAAQDVRLTRHGRPVRRLDADRRGAGGQWDVSGRLEERRPISTWCGPPTATATSSRKAMC